ncbi:hypothetical protein [Nonomuraea aurantiaca]|uniref:hypothetical protein n=1 Tax=Nonomuraea aurantiaca TaxID=2878562 RepID=UPI001CDA22A7|nr:hypothetical protein [Nonomuraea aurantiaca]MCA2224461.1 hypothetical protein [Nonomuraea aurantiaca]
MWPTCPLRWAGTVSRRPQGDLEGAGVDLAQVGNPRAYLIRIAVRRSLERLRGLRAAREDHTGPCLPEHW